MGSVGVSGVEMAERGVLAPVYLHSTGFPGVFLSVGAVCSSVLSEQEQRGGRTAPRTESTATRRSVARGGGATRKLVRERAARDQLRAAGLSAC